MRLSLCRLRALASLAKLKIGKHRLELAEARENAGAGRLRQAVCDEAEHLLSSFDFWCGVVKRKKGKDSPFGRVRKVEAEVGYTAIPVGSRHRYDVGGRAFVSSCGQPRRTTTLPAAFVNSTRISIRIITMTPLKMTALRLYHLQVAAAAVTRSCAQQATACAQTRLPHLEQLLKICTSC